MNWQPIETGPTDTPVAVMDSRGEIFTARYCTKGKAWIDQRRDEWPEYELKLWRPLPPPPTVTQSLTVPLDDDLDEPLGPACNRDNPECESCQ